MARHGVRVWRLLFLAHDAGLCEREFFPGQARSVSRSWARGDAERQLRAAAHRPLLRRRHCLPPACRADAGDPDRRRAGSELASTWANIQSAAGHEALGKVAALPAVLAVVFVLLLVTRKKSPAAA